MDEEVEFLHDEDDSLTSEKSIWDRQAVFLLIREYKKFKAELTNPDVRKRCYWEIICNNLAAHGYFFDVEQCEKKWRNLKKTFKENEGKPVVAWAYYDALKDIFLSESNVTKQKNNLEAEKSSNNVPEMNADSGSDNSSEDNTADEEDSPPTWFTEFLIKNREDEKMKMKMLEDMHQEILRLEKQKCGLLKTVIEKLS